MHSLADLLADRKISFVTTLCKGWQRASTARSITCFTSCKVTVPSHVSKSVALAHCNVVLGSKSFDKLHVNHSELTDVVAVRMSGKQQLSMQHT